MRRITPVLLAAWMWAGSALPAGATPVTLVDTGPGPGDLSTLTDSWSLGVTEDVPAQWLAAEFELDDAFVITSLELWMYVIEAGDFTFGIYSDAGEVPGSELFAGTFAGSISDDAEWLGLMGLEWSLGPGTYWATFETGRSVTPGYGGAPFPSMSPLGNEAFQGFFGWQESDDLSLGVRIMGEPATAVPEPGTLGLLTLGLAGLLSAQRRRRNDMERCERV